MAMLFFIGFALAQSEANNSQQTSLCSQRQSAIKQPDAFHRSGMEKDLISHRMETRAFPQKSLAGFSHPGFSELSTAWASWRSAA
jgi:predicted DNA-binding transcriptional regulator AlpA